MTEQKALPALGSLSSIATLLTVVVIVFTAGSKLNAIDNHSQANCQLLSNGIILTLETSKIQATTAAERARLLAAQERFAKIGNEC